MLNLNDKKTRNYKTLVALATCVLNTEYVITNYMYIIECRANSHGVPASAVSDTILVYIGLNDTIYTKHQAVDWVPYPFEYQGQAASVDGLCRVTLGVNGP